MALFKKKKSKKSSLIPAMEQLVDKRPYEERTELVPIVVVTTIVNRNQARYFEDAYQKVGASLSMTLFAHSLPPEEIRNVMGEDETKKEIILTVCRKDLVPKIKEIAATRFGVSELSKGVLFVSPIDAVSGIVAYKYLADMSREGQKNGN